MNRAARDDAEATRDGAAGMHKDADVTRDRAQATSDHAGATLDGIDGTPNDIEAPRRAAAADGNPASAVGRVANPFAVPRPLLSARTRAVAAVLLLIFGVQLWLIIGRGQYGSAPPPLLLAAVVAVAAILPLARVVSGALDRLRSPSPRARAVTAGVVFVVALAYLIFTGFRQQRPMIPAMHDEFMHLLQVRTLADGKLWTAPHPAADSFETFHIFVKPVYASIYFPGTALMYVPAAWLGLPYWLLPAVVAAACAALFYRVTAELLDGVAGLLAALLLVSVQQYRFLSMMVISHGAMLLLSLATVAAWLRWRHSPTLARAAVIGLLGGWAAITRPVDAICCAIPIAVAMLWRLRELPGRRAVATMAVVVAAAAPFLALQIVQNVGITGDALTTPYRRYCDLFTPQMTFGFRHAFDPAARPATSLPQRIEYYDTYTVRAAAAHRPETALAGLVGERLPAIAYYGLPSALLLIVLPLALLDLRRDRLAMLAPLPLLACAYAMFPYFLPHYALVVAPAVIFGVLLGARQVERVTPPRVRPAAVILTSGLLVLLALRALPEFNRLIADDPRGIPLMKFDARLESMVQAPALVLYRFASGDDPHEEPVYNLQATSPDEARVVRAQDRPGEPNRKLFEHYAAKRPDRKVYLVERARASSDRSYRPQYLGTAAELARGSRAAGGRVSATRPL